MHDETTDRLPLAPGDRGEAVRDLHRRLVAAGVDLLDGPVETYAPHTLDAVRQFQADRGLPPTGTCDRHTWTAIVEAGFRLGDRLLYLRSPMLRGDDVADLQLRLGALGFDAGRVDGIFGPDTERALKDFQRNFALTIDGVCGRDVLSAFARLGTRIDQARPVVGVRERERLREGRRPLQDCRIVLGEAMGLDAITTALAREVQAVGAVVAVQQHPDPSVQATEANRFEADLYLGLEIDDVGPCRTAFYSTSGFQSVGGYQLATVVTAVIEQELDLPCAPPMGMRLPVLRETRMPAVVCTLGPASAVVATGTRLARTLALAIGRWTDSPVDT